MPWVLRVLLENLARTTDASQRQQNVDAVLGWLDHRTSKHEIEFSPSRILMHDTTSTPALVDIAAMRDVLAEHGVNPRVLDPCLQVDISVDHSLAVESFGSKDSAFCNLRLEIERNQERYEFLRWAEQAFRNIKVHPPGTGIMHTLNLEQLAQVVIVDSRFPEPLLAPETMIGTDSHTPMINGIGVLGWGVGGLEAQTVMFGMPMTLRIPEIIGVRLTGELSDNVCATDLALVITHRLRQLDVSERFVEFFGPGVSNLTAGQRAVIANMAPEYGATTGYFAIDDQTLRYLRGTGKAEDLVARVESYAKEAGLWFDPQATPRYTQQIEVDLCSVKQQAAGPQRPQDLLPISAIGSSLRLHTDQETNNGLPQFPVAIAAITSCTNTSDPALLIAAGLLAQRAYRLGLRVPGWVKTSLAPGSPAAQSYMERAGLLHSMSALGFDIVGFGCSTCIGNSGSLLPNMTHAQKAGQAKAVAILSGNRNFPGRVHPEIELAFIMSPALVVAYAIAGDATINLDTEPIQQSPSGEPVFLRDLWPLPHEIQACLDTAVNPYDFSQDFKTASANPVWWALNASSEARYPWAESSTILRRPPFAAVDEKTSLGSYTAFPLLVLGDDITTDHISPAGAIPAESAVADYLVSRGEDRDNLNVFASRRGNWEVMARGAFLNKSVKNMLQEKMPVGHTLHIPSGDVIALWDAALKYRDAGCSLVVVAGDRYGMGSSRDWAAKAQWLLGIRAVLATGFERIHRSNLIGMGILPLTLASTHHPSRLQIAAGDQFEISAEPAALAPRCEVMVTLVRQDGSRLNLQAKAAIETRFEVELLQAGGIIPRTLRRAIASDLAKVCTGD